MRARFVLGAAIISLGLAAATADAQQSTREALDAKVAAGDAAWDRGEHDAAFAEYDVVVRADSTFSRRALVRVGTFHSWSSRYGQAVAALTLATRLGPTDAEARGALARVLSWAQRYPAAIAHYDTLLTLTPDARDVVLGRANVLAWSGRYAQAIAALEAWQRTYPGEIDVALQRARVLAWAGRYQEAEALFDSLSTGAGAAEAERGRARVKSWRGDLTGSEAAWRAVLVRSPDDVDALVGLGTVLRWQGRPFDARAQLERALVLAPDNNEAREGMRWVRAETAPSSAATLIVADDSERNALTSLVVSGALAWPGNLKLTASARAKRVTQGVGAASVIPGFETALQWQPLGALALRVSGGAVQTASGLNSSVVQPFGAARAIGRLGSRVTVGGGVSRFPFDDLEATALRRLAFTSVDADLGVRVHPRVTLSGDVGRTLVTGDLPDNSRTMASGAVTWSPFRGVQSTVTHRVFWWDAPVPGVYFAPQRFSLDEVALQWFRAADLGLIALGELGAGTQSIRFDGRPTDRSVTPRAQVRLGWRAAPGREITLGLLWANVAAAADLTNAQYTYGAATLQARWVF